MCNGAAQKFYFLLPICRFKVLGFEQMLAQNLLYTLYCRTLEICKVVILKINLYTYIYTITLPMLTTA